MAGMSYATLSLEQTPPLGVPFRFFLTAPLFAAVAGFLLLLYGPDVYASRWGSWTLGLTHLLTLGFLAQVMVGAVQQLLPVLMGSPVPRPLLVSGTLHLLLTTGTVALVSGLLGSSPGTMAAAAVLLGGGLALFLIVTGWCLSRARSGHFTVRTVGLALLSLALTVALGTYLSAAYAGAGALNREFTDIHLGFGLIGWVGLLVVGVAYQVVPMFQITPDYPRWVMRWLGPLMFVMLLAWALARLLSAPQWLALLPAALLAICYGGFAVMTLWLQHRRKRRLADVTLDYWRLAMLSLLAAVAVWAWGQAAGSVPGLTLGVLFVVGFAVSAVSGMLYKIVPFLIWLHLNNRLQLDGRPQGGIPNMRKVISEPPMRWQFRLHLAALVLLLGGTLWPILARPAGLALLGSSAWLGANLFSALGVYRRMTGRHSQGASA